MKRRSRVSRTSSQDILPVKNKTLMSGEFDEFMHEKDLEHRDRDQISVTFILLSKLFMISSFSIRRRFSRRIFSKNEESSTIKDKQRENLETDHHQDQELSKASNEKLITDVDLSQSLYSKVSYNRNAIVILLIKSREALSEYSDIQFENIAAFVAIFQLLSKKRKKNYITQAKRYLNSVSSHFIDQSHRYFSH
jgi:hypothetical protein